MADDRIATLARYDLITYYRCGASIEEMTPSENGDWVKFADVEAALRQVAAQTREDAARIVEQQAQWHYGEGADMGRAIAAAIRKGQRFAIDAEVRESAQRMGEKHRKSLERLGADD